jgi:hypothetical protein
MKVTLIASLVLALVSTHAFAATDHVTFDGSVREGDGPATSFKVDVPRGQTSKVMLGDGTVVELIAGASSRSEVNLLSATGANLHHAVWPSNPPTKFRYAICGSRAVYVSPPDAANEATCSK